MTLGARIRKIREIRGLKQKEMAAKMHVTPKTYSTLEEGINPKYPAMQKFCEATGIELYFLFADDVPVTEENVAFFDSMKDKSFLLCYEQLRQKVDVFGDLLHISRNNSNF